jgi:cytochrome b6-f complex iron-sulfur subunit
MTLVYGLVGIGILGLISIVVLFRRRDTSLATGHLKEPSQRDLVIKDKSEMIGKSYEVEALRSNSKSLELADSDGVTVFTPPDEVTLGVTRRQFLNRSAGSLLGLSLLTGGAGTLAFLFPGTSKGFGAKIDVGTIADIKAGIKAGSGFYYVPQGRMWITEYPESAVVKAQTAYGFFPQVQQGLENGVVALFQTCPHLGCRVPECKTSQWFECPCHGSQYNSAGEKKGGPAPRGMDRFPMEVSSSGVLSVDTGTVIPGPAVGINTTGQEAEGPHCLSSGGGH